MAGGIGSRFWPASREAHPKQFLDILGIGKSLLQITYERFEEWVTPKNIIVLTYKDYKELVKEQLPNIPEINILCEPARRNTAPCIAYAAFKIFKQDPEADMIVVSSDHLILKPDVFLEGLKTCVRFLENKASLVTLGIKAVRPDTGYGYIKYGDSMQNGICKVEDFTEKPDLETAKRFLSQGNYAWNAGIFIWSVSEILKAFMHYAPEIYKVFERGLAYYNTVSEESFLNQHYSEATNISIDYAIMEKADNVYTLPVDIGWSDLGTWNSLHAELEKDHNRNVINSAMVLSEDSEDNLIRLPHGKLAIIKGLNNFIVVDEEDVLLIWPKDKEQEIKSLTSKIKESFGNQYT